VTNTQIAELTAARIFANTMLGIVYACDLCDRLMVRLGVGRV
jgi:hypothetical protein